MNIVIFGLTITSSWGNGHATTFRGLASELTRNGHNVLFVECNKPWYAANRDLPSPEFCDLELYESLHEVHLRFAATVANADAVMIGSYVPEGIELSQWVLRTATGPVLFYDIDTPVTLQQLRAGCCHYVSREVIPAFDAYLSFSGGPILEVLEKSFHARNALPFYCSFDPAVYFPESHVPRWALGYLGTYSADRQPGLERLLLGPALKEKKQRFIVVGPQYPDSITWPSNVQRIEHLSPDRHRWFYNSQRFTLNLTRQAMTAAGFSPSVRLFEAAACETPIISDYWAGIESFFAPGREILIADSTEDVRAILRNMTEKERRQIGANARARVLAEHTAAHRARSLERLIRDLRSGRARHRVLHEEARL